MELRWDFLRIETYSKTYVASSHGSIDMASERVNVFEGFVFAEGRPEPNISRLVSTISTTTETRLPISLNSEILWGPGLQVIREPKNALSLR